MTEQPKVDAQWLAERRRIAEAATKGPWLAGWGTGVTGPRACFGVYLDDKEFERVPVRHSANDVVTEIVEDIEGCSKTERLMILGRMEADAAFIADARTAVPVLVAECEHRRETVRIASKLAGKEITDFEPETIGGFLARVNGLRLREERANERIAALEADNARLRALTGGAS